MGAEPEAADFALAQEHSDAESDVRRLQYDNLGRPGPDWLAWNLPIVKC